MYSQDLVCVPRPYTPPVERLSISSHGLEYGFPSTHSTNAVSISLYFAQLYLQSTRGDESILISSIALGLCALYAVSVVSGSESSLAFARRHMLRLMNRNLLRNAQHDRSVTAFARPTSTETDQLFQTALRGHSSASASGMGTCWSHRHMNSSSSRAGLLFLH